MLRVVAALLVALALAPAALAYELPAADQAVLDAAATWIAQQPVTVRCLNHDEYGSPWAQDAWGYVYPNEPVEYMDVAVCDGALALVHHDASVPAWERANGALVFAHESFHLRLNLGDRRNEASTECRAIRHVAYMMRRLGADPTEVDALMPYALAEHFRLAARHQEYFRRACVTPWYW